MLDILSSSSLENEHHILVNFLSIGSQVEFVVEGYMYCKQHKYITAVLSRDEGILF